MAQTITDLFLTVWKLRPEWGKGAIGQDGQVTILDLQKHMAYHIWKFLVSNSLILIYKPYRRWKFPTYHSSKVVGKEYSSHGLE